MEKALDARLIYTLALVIFVWLTPIEGCVTALTGPSTRICLGFTPLDGLPSPRLRSPIYPTVTGSTAYSLTVAGEPDLSV